MRHALVFTGLSGMRYLLTIALEEEGYAVTTVMNADDALMTLRSALHPIVTLVQLDGLPAPITSFFEPIRDHPELYGEHRYIAISAWPHSQEELDLLAELGALLLRAPFTLDELTRLVEQAFASLP